MAATFKPRRRYAIQHSCRSKLLFADDSKVNETDRGPASMVSVCKASDRFVR